MLSFICVIVCDLCDSGCKSVQFLYCLLIFELSQIQLSRGGGFGILSFVNQCSRSYLLHHPWVNYPEVRRLQQTGYLVWTIQRHSWNWVKKDRELIQTTPPPQKKTTQKTNIMRNTDPKNTLGPILNPISESTKVIYSNV